MSESDGDYTGGDVRMQDFDRYQYLSRLTAIYPSVGGNLIYPTLGLNGEAGEIAEKVKKLLRDDGGVITNEFVSEIAQELGDVLWYVAAICSEIRVPMSDIAQGNIDKLYSRASRKKLSGSGDNR